jgi:hypothetical protein
MSKEKCTCGEPTANCPVWGSFATPAASQPQWRHRDLVLALLQHAAGKYAVLTDSSKSAWGTARMPFSLRRELGDEFALIHLVRDPRGVSWSALKKAERQGKSASQPLRCVATACGWSVANSACALFGWLYPNQYTRLRYEDLVRSPQVQVISLFKAIMPSLSCNLNDLGIADNRHQLFGNRVRSRMPALTEIKEDRAWKTEIPRRYRWLTDVLTWPLCGRLGY